MWRGIEGGGKKNNNKKKNSKMFFEIFIQHSGELKNIHAPDFIFYFQIFWGGRIWDIVIIKSC